MKTCSICETTKPLGHFYALKTGRFGVSSRCKPCDNGLSRAYRAANGTAVKAQRQGHREGNRERLAAASRADYHAHRTARRATQKAYYESHREERRLYNQKWREENQEWLQEYEKARAGQTYIRNIVYRSVDPEKWRQYAAEYSRERGNRLRKAQPPWANPDEIKEMYLLCRLFSDVTGVPHHVDHIIPLKGKNVCGLHIETNLQILTAEENRKKSNSFAQD